MAGRPKGSKSNTKWIIDEEKLTKGEVRKLNALRKSIGENFGEEGFMKWYEAKEAGGDGEAHDLNAQLIQDTLWPLVRDKKLKLPRSGGYGVKRGRGRILVEMINWEK